MTSIYQNIKLRRKQLGFSQQILAEKCGYTDRSSIAKIEAGLVDLTASKIDAFAKALNTTRAELLGENSAKMSGRTDYYTFPVIGDVAAGYDSLAHSDYDTYDGETVDIPASYFKGRHRCDFFVLRVKGQSMYPDYMDGDKVLILRSSSLTRSGQVGVVVYDDEYGTLKKVEFKKGENWLRLIPLNPAFKTVTIKDEQLEHCKVLGIPKLIIRQIDE